jgi:hypothetical protein
VRAALRLSPALELGDRDEDAPATTNDAELRQDVLLEEVDRAAEGLGSLSLRERQPRVRIVLGELGAKLGDGRGALRGQSDALGANARESSASAPTLRTALDRTT